VVAGQPPLGPPGQGERVAAGHDQSRGVQPNPFGQKLRQLGVAHLPPRRLVDVDVDIGAGIGPSGDEEVFSVVQQQQDRQPG
jgi:hypothetical protein